MSNSYSKEDLSFLVKAMERRAKTRNKITRVALTDDRTGANDKVGGGMTIPKPVTVDVNGTMSASDYKACSTIMAVCQNMVQKSITDAAQQAGVTAGDALKNMNAWIKAYTDFPFPFFNFKDTQSQIYQKDGFSLTANPDAVATILNISNLAALKDAVVGAIRSAGGNLASYENTDQKFNYFGIVTAYFDTEIAIRVIKFQMNLKQTKVSSLCAGVEKTRLDTAYDTYQFAADKDLMIKTQAKMGDKLVDYFAEKLLEFVKAFYDAQFEEYLKNLAQSLKK
jgi:hypothetical protein